jgi:Lrp/AsnC family transcriptional regulator for asnA, asnC and gidA
MKFEQFTRTDKKVKLDAKDKKILFLLSKNSRLPLTKIARQAGLSRDSVAYRVNNLTEAGVIQGYITLVNMKKFGYDAYHVFLNLNHPTREIENRIINSLKHYPFVRAILKFSGKYDFELALVAKDIQEFDSILSIITGLCSNYMQNYEILIISRNYTAKVFPNNFFQPSQDPARHRKDIEADFDEKDIEMLRIISTHADMPLYEIGGKVGLSADAAKYRIRKMRESGIIVNFVPVINYSSLDYSIYAILLSLSNLTEKKEALLRQILDSDENVLWAVKTIGKYNVLFYLCVRNANDVHGTILKLRNCFKEDIREYETLIAQEEFKYCYFPEGIDL